MPDDPLSLRLYRKLLKLYPAGFQEEYAGAMERAYRDELRESTGILLWLRLLGDLAVSLPGQLAREIGQDTRHTVRLWAARPWHTAFAILALAIGMGANTGVFSVVNALLLRSLPFHEPERLGTIGDFFPPLDTPGHFHDWRAHSTYLEDAAMWETGDVNLGGSVEWQRARVAQTSWNFFAMLGSKPVIGRTFAPEEEANGSGWGPGGQNAVAVISYGLWQSRYGGEANALGATIRIDGNPLTVIGVAPPGFDYPRRTVIWKPAAYSGGNFGWTTIGRLKSGLTWERARSEAVAEGYRLSAGRGWPHGKPSTLTPLRDELAGPAKSASMVLLAAVALILLIACTNVANLLTARMAERSAELSVRSALGASRARLTQQLLTECVLLSLTATAAGFAVAFATTSMAAKLQPAALATQRYSLLDSRVLMFAIAVSVLSALLFGVLPALYASRIHRFATRGFSDGPGARAVRDSLVVIQVAVTIVLLTASVSLGRAFTAIMHLYRGFDRTGVVTAEVSLQGTHIETDAARREYFQQAFDRLKRLPGVRSVSSTQFLPLSATSFMGARFNLEGRRASRNSMVVPVMPDYFRTMGAQILAGREFTPADLQSSAEPVLVDTGFAREFGEPADLVGRHVDAGGRTRTVVGVVRNMDYLAEGANGSEIFILSRSPGSWPGATIVVKVAGRAEDRMAAIRDTIQSIDRGVPVFGVQTMQQRMDNLFARPQFYRTAVMFFALFAVVLATIGIYGIVSYTVARRTHEMGVRMALGTTSESLRARVLRQGLAPIVWGAIPGIALAIISGRLLESLVTGAKPVDALTYAGVTVFILTIAAAGIWTATRPIAKLDISDILRAE